MRDMRFITIGKLAEAFDLSIDDILHLIKEVHLHTGTMPGAFSVPYEKISFEELFAVDVAMLPGNVEDRSKQECGAGGYCDELMDKMLGGEIDLSEAFGYHLLPLCTVEKKKALQVLGSWDYPLQKEVKGLTRDLFDRDNRPSIVVVPSDVWQGKSNSAVRDAMRKKNFPDHVIAYVLYDWCRLHNDTEIGKLLFVSKGGADPERGKGDDACRRRGKSLRDTASKVTIVQG